MLPASSWYQRSFCTKQGAAPFRSVLPAAKLVPEHLQGRAREAWKFWSEELESMDLDRRPDAHMLEGCCVAYDAAVDAYETILKQGRLIA